MLRQVRANDEGATAVEYAIVLVAMALGSIAILAVFFTVAVGVYDQNCDVVGANGIASAPRVCPLIISRSADPE